ncbi:MAG: VanW family protein [Clostridia bacterium]|jgi:VanW family protein
MIEEKEKIVEQKDIPKVKEPGKHGKEKSNKKVIIICSIIAIIIVIAILSTIFALINSKNEKMLNGISINGISVSGKDKVEVKEILSEKIEAKKTEDLVVKLDAKTEEGAEYKGVISFEQLQLNYKLDEAIEKAYNIGRDSNIFVNNFNIVKTFFAKNNIEIPYEYNEEELNKQIDTINGQIPGAVIESSYDIDEDKKELVITKGKEGLEVDPELLKQEVENEIKNVESGKKEINLSTKNKEPNQINLDKIYSEIHTEPQNAYYTQNPFTLYPHVDGIDFAISMEEAKKILEENKEEYIIPLKITHPEITTDKIGSEGFPDLLAEFSTNYNPGAKDRTTNLRLASNKINNTVVLPGETFSYNKVVGKRTTEAGYKEAPSYAGGKVVNDIGGGICQITSTLYNAVVLANLDIVSRSNHQFVPSYVKAGRDATVVYGAIDFKFKNTRKYPIKIKSTVSGGVARVQIYGMKEETEYEVKIETKITGSIPMKTVYEDDPTLEKGKEKVEQKGHNGTYSEAYKVVYLNGKVVSRTLLSKDKYNQMSTIIKRGTKGVEAPPVEPEVPQEPDVPTNPEIPEKPEEPVEPPVIPEKPSEGNNIN